MNNRKRLYKNLLLVYKNRKIAKKNCIAKYNQTFAFS